jgi:hypothetical protein
MDMRFVKSTDPMAPILENNPDIRLGLYLPDAEGGLPGTLVKTRLEMGADYWLGSLVPETTYPAV